MKKRRHKSDHDRPRGLVLTLYDGDRVVIGDPKSPIGIVGLGSIGQGRVRLCFEFSRDIPVNRESVIKDRQ